MPGAMPRRPALSFTAKIFSSGGLPSKIATACARNSGSARRVAATGKFGTKMQANGMDISTLSIESLSRLVPLTDNWLNCSLAQLFSSRPGSFAGERDRTEPAGLRSSRERITSAVISSSVSNCAWVGLGN